MFLFDTLKVKWKIILPYTGLIFLIVGAMLSWYVISETKRLETQQLRTMGIILQNVAAASAHPLAIREYDRLQDLLTHLTSLEADVQYAYLINKQGRILASTDSTMQGKVLPVGTPENAQSLPSGVMRVDLANGDTAYELRCPVILFNTVMGELRAGVSTERIYETIQGYVYVNMVIGLATVIIGIIVFYWLIRVWVDQPILELHRTAQQISSGQLESRIEHTAQDELGDLAKAFNHMTAQLLQMRSGLEQEIAERKRVETELRASEEQLLSFVETTVSLIISLSPDGTILAFNPEAERLYGQTQDEVVGENYFELFLPENVRAAVSADMRKVFAGEPTRGMENPIRTRDGHERVIRWNANRLLDPQGQPTAIVAVGQDITDHKRTETEREALLEEIAAKNAELERFTYTVSHDLKSPLITINGFLGFLHESAMAGDTERMRSDIAQINSAVTIMQQLLEDLLELSRIGRLVSPPEHISFTELAHEAVTLITGQLTERGVEVIIAPDLPTVYGDRLRLREVLQNLLDNATKYMGDQPHPRIEIGVRYEGSRRTFFVKDNGIGIVPAYCKTVFGLFEKLDHHAEGTGIGLAIVKRIVEVHGGSVWVESDGPGTGSTFHLSLT